MNYHYQTDCLVWCAACERRFWIPTPPDVWSWLREHRRFGLCGPV